MPTTTPFNPSLPLYPEPYYSRITDNLDTTGAGLDDIKNYWLTGFKPGFPLQASELNELQEQFYIQHTLSNTCIHKWWNKGTSGPFWSSGATPLDPAYFTATKTGTNTATIVLSSGWLHLNSAGVLGTNGLGVWVYNPVNISYTTDVTVAAQFGVYYKQTIVDYTTDENLTDNSGGGARTGYGFINSGADRIKLTRKADGTETGTVFYSIFYTSSGGSTVKTMNDHTIYTK